MVSNTFLLCLTLVVAAAVILTRASSFILFPPGKETPKVILFLGDSLPCALMALLVVYCLKSISVIAAPHGIPELIAIAVVAGLHIWRHNTLLSITVGTIIYMVLVQAVF